MQDYISIVQELYWYLGLKNTPYAKRIIFLFFGYLKTSHKKSFLYKNVNINDSHQQKTTRTFLYIGPYIGQKY